MALANTAWILASNGYRVLMVDWDLEAPGLHRYFHPFLDDKRLADTKGVIDLVFAYQRSVLALPESEGIRRFPSDWYDEKVDILPYTRQLMWTQPGFGSLLASVERLGARLTQDQVKRMQPIPAPLREEVLAAYERRSATPSDPAAHAAGIFKRLGVTQEETARNILLRLVAPAAGGAAFRTAVATDGSSEDEGWLVKRLVDEGLLSRKLAEDGETEYIMIADERLIDSWPTLRGWIQEQADVLRFRNLLEERAERWERGGRHWGLLLSEGEIAPAKQAAGDGRLVHPRIEAFVNESESYAIRRGEKEKEAEAVKATATRQSQLRRRLALWAPPVFAALALLLYSFPRLQTLVETYRVLSNVQTRVNKQDGQKYAWLPPGRFEMGCSEDAPGFACSSFEVELKSGFWMDQTEVTNDAYRGFLSARHPNALSSHPADKYPSNYPVSNVTWLDAYDYCSWAGGSLPSSAEWEYAARAGTRGKRFITGDTLVENKISLGSAPKPVRSYAPNTFGLFDMSGNVAEWTDASLA